MLQSADTLNTTHTTDTVRSSTSFHPALTRNMENSRLKVLARRQQLDFHNQQNQLQTEIGDLENKTRYEDFDRHMFPIPTATDRCSPDEGIEDVDFLPISPCDASGADRMTMSTSETRTKENGQFEEEMRANHTYMSNLNEMNVHTDSDDSAIEDLHEEERKCHHQRKPKDTVMSYSGFKPVSVDNDVESERELTLCEGVTTLPRPFSPLTVQGKSLSTTSQDIHTVNEIVTGEIDTNTLKSLPHPHRCTSTFSTPSTTTPTPSSTSTTSTDKENCPQTTTSTKKNTPCLSRNTNCPKKVFSDISKENREFVNSETQQTKHFMGSRPDIMRTPCSRDNTLKQERGSGCGQEVFLRAVVLGDYGVGKSQMLQAIQRACSSEKSPFTCSAYRPHEFLELSVCRGGRRFRLKLLDTAGQERFRSITSSYFRGVQGCLLVFNLNRQDSFDNIMQWYQDVNRNSDDILSTLLVGVTSTTQSLKEREVTSERAFKLAEALQTQYLETTMRDQETLLSILERMVGEVAQHIPEDPRPKPRVSICPGDKPKPRRFVFCASS